LRVAGIGTQCLIDGPAQLPVNRNTEANGAFMPETDKKRIPGNTFGMAGVFWVASELSRRNWIALPTVRNQKGVDIIATATRPSGSKFVEIQVKASQRRGFWLLGPMKRKKIPNRKSLFFVFVRPQSASPPAGFEAFVVPSIKVCREAKQQQNRKFQFCWYPPEKPEMYKERWDTLG
jgi:hypothetical protein